jgi:hypothetical protein
MTDTQLIEWMHSNMDWDGEGYWLPDVCIRERAWGEENCKRPTSQEFRAVLTAKAQEYKQEPTP